MEVEMKKLQESIKDATERFDETLTRLFEKKVKYEMAICQVVYCCYAASFRYDSGVFGTL